MNHRQLRYFCEVARQGTLARAAERLCVAPTAISMQIAQLEQGLGGELFDRAVKPMALTALGRFFLPRALQLLDHGEQLEKEARDIAVGNAGWLGIGFVRSVMNSFLPAAVRRFRALRPGVRLELIEMLSEHQAEHLRSGRIQIGLSRYARLPEPPADLRHTVLFEDPFLVALPAEHPLAAQAVLSVTALQEMELISYPKDPQSSFAQNITAILQAAGVRPRVGHEAIEIHTALGLVAAGLGYAVVGASVARRGTADVAFVPLQGLDARTTVLTVTRADDQGPLTASMLQALDQAARDIQAN
ncbi:LysR family transcriptional regulator [Xylophilus sp. GOD-11R]|uniref:LysR family transcriptional regulator n=1 Tax=Xylophilus sp. GOD-11R TaxID=3089814 RepID=UPI00298C880C|nr:LysR family transcriptional regulator [Xylophilus sp. GOD-11R]WPB57705.1 LysR family transcriptional regulator [Xylophilus sp. GOD-11R]